jgi:hypothetical protein
MKSGKVEEENARLVENLLASVRNRKPILKDPEGLTEDIMNTIRDNPARKEQAIKKKARKLPAIIILRRLMAAASVCLLLVFGYEEYVVVEKISQLEQQSSAISRSSQYQAALNLKKIMTVLTLNPQMINQYLDFKTKKIDIRTIFKAAMIADAGVFSPDALNLLNKAGYNPKNQDIISFLNNFDATHHTRQR